MKAIVVREFGDPSVLQLSEVEDLRPGPGEVVVSVKAVGVNPVDTYVRSGNYARKPALPYTPGSDGAGIVESVGEGVRNVKEGQRVYLAGSITGTYAEKARLLAADAHPLPDGVSFEQGACVNVPYATAYRSLFQKAHARAGEVVLVHGASGGVGIASVQLARAHGLTVIGTAGTEEGMELVKREGAHYALNHRQEGYIDELKRITEENGGVDVVLEMLANVNLATDLIVLAPEGRVVVVGNRGAIEINPREMMARESTVVGVALARATPREKREIHAGLYAGLESGTLRPIVGKTIPLAEASRAHIEIMESSHHGNIVLIP